MNASLIESGTKLILEGLGVDLADRNFAETPQRVARMMRELFVPKESEHATFPEDYNDFILLHGHRMHSLCPHHLLPVEFTVSLAYIPSGQVLGLSKLARLLDECNNGPLLQEKFTRDCVARLMYLCPGTQGAACLIKGQHGCTRIRGVKSDAHFITYKLAGVFLERPELEERFFTLCRDA